MKANDEMGGVMILAGDGEGELAGNSKTSRLEQCIPADTVAVPDPDQDEAMVPPEEGDTVRYEVEGKVTRTEGGHVYVQPVAINGQPVNGNDEQPAEEAELDKLRDEAGAMDAGGAAGLGGY